MTYSVFQSKTSHKSNGKCNIQSVQKTHKEFLGSIFLNIYAYGNYAPEKINVFAKEVRNYYETLQHNQNIIDIYLISNQFLELLG